MYLAVGRCWASSGLWLRRINHHVLRPGRGIQTVIVAERINWRANARRNVIVLRTIRAPNEDTDATMFSYPPPPWCSLQCEAAHLKPLCHSPDIPKGGQV